MINKTSQNKNKGFTLIEVLVAIFILITAVVVPLTIGSKAFAYSNFVRDQSTASYLAQEAVEYIRLERDNASLQGIGWDGFKFRINQCSIGVDLDDDAPGGCRFDVRESSPSIISCDGKCPAMYLDSNGNYYTYANTSGKWFLRSVETRVEGENTPLERVRVDVTVVWNTNGVDERRFEVIDYLTPWQI